MRPIPDTLRDTDGDPLFELLRGKDLKEFSEEDYDRLLVRNIDSVAQALRNSQLIGERSGLKVICASDIGGGQLLNIDVLCAEVDESNGDFIRLVLFEDKLQKNPEQRRKVLAQVLDYICELTSSEGRGALARRLAQQDAEWWYKHEAMVLGSLEDEDLLAVIVGDELNERLVELVRQHVKRQSPLSLLKWGLLGLSQYRAVRGGGTLVVPQVVGASVQIERPLELRVVVEDQVGKPVMARVEEVLDGARPGAARTRKGRWTPEEFREALKSNECGLAVFERLDAWAAAGGVIVYYGAGASVGYWYARPEPDRDGVLSFTTDGRVCLSLGNLWRHADRYERPEERLEFLEQIRTIWERPDIPEERIDTWMFLPSDPIEREEGWARFKTLLDRVYLSE